MKSYTCQFELLDILRLTAGPAVTVAAFAVLMHLGAASGLLPAPRPTLDTDRTIVIHQADASRGRDNARILLVGDTSCLMNVSARQLAGELKQPALNLATLSFLDAGAGARQVRAFVRANPAQLQAVVLLTHPEALRRIGAEPYHLAVLTNYLAGTDHHRSESASGQLAWVLGLDIFKGRLLARTRPSPVPGEFGRTCGFSANVASPLTAARGSLEELDSLPLLGSGEFRLAESLQAGAREFRSAMPPGAKLFVGLTPVPEKIIRPEQREVVRTILRQWGDWLGADAILDDLPTSLPDEKFARSTHLTPDAVPEYTATLARSLARRLP